MENIKESIEKLVHAELQRANNYTTRQTIYQRVVSAIAQDLNVLLHYNLESKSVYLHPDNAARIEKQWHDILLNNINVSHEESNAYQKIMSVDYIQYQDLFKFINILVRKTTVSRDPQSKEKIMKSRAVPELLAMDGFAGYANANTRNYVDNLRVGDASEHEHDQHLVAVRHMYSLLSPNLTGTDAVCVVYLSLLTLYGKQIQNQEALNTLNEVVDNVSDYLVKNATYYTELKEAMESLDKLQACYSAKVDVVKTAMVKVSQLLQREKRVRQKSSSKKRGRKRLNTEMKEEEVEKKESSDSG